MKSILTVFGLIVVFTHLALSQSNVSNPLKINMGLTEVAKSRYPELFLARDEFETTAEYQARCRRQAEVIAQVKAELDAVRQTRLQREEQRIQAQIAASRQAVTLAVGQLGAYTADTESFPVTVAGQTYTVKIPRAEARSFKDNVSRAHAQGFKQLQRDLNTWEYFNLALIHPVTGNRYPFGPQKELAETGGTAPAQKALVPPQLTMQVVFTEANGNGFLDAGEKGQVKATLSNQGRGSALGVSVSLRPDDKDPGVSAEASQVIGEIPAGQSRSVTFGLAAAKTVRRQVNQFTISATEANGFPPDPVMIRFESYPFIPPRLELVDFGITTATGEAVIKPGVSVEVQARVQNRGQGEATQTQFEISLPQGVYFTPESKSTYRFGSLKPGEYKDLVFTLLTSKTVGKEITINIRYIEDNTQGSLPLTLAVDKTLNTVQQLVVRGQEMSQSAAPDVASLSVDVEKEIPSAASIRTQDFAVVFGIESYKNIPGVTFARRDAQWMKTYFEKVLGIPAANIYFKTDADVSLAEFNTAFSGWLQKRIRKNESNVFIFYAGHGAPELKHKKAYLIPYDGNPNYPEQTGYELNKLYSELNALGARSVTVFLDACFSGANRNQEMLLADARPVMIEIEGSAWVGDVTVFSAASGAQIASAWPEKKHGLFSYYLLKGLQGAADTDQNRVITVKELADYIYGQVSQTAGLLDREQTPELRTTDEQRVVARLK